MKLGVMSACFGGMELKDALAYCKKVGLDAIELPAGAYPGDPWDLGTILDDPGRLADLKKMVDDNGLVVQGIAVHGNPVHPDEAIAAEHAAAQRNGVRLAAEFETVVINFSGCPGGAAGDKPPHFVPWPWPVRPATAPARASGCSTWVWPSTNRASALTRSSACRRRRQC